MIFLLGLILFLWFGFWSAQAGHSIGAISPKLYKWQEKVSWFSQLPEAIIALTISGIGLWGVNQFADMPLLYSIILMVLFSAVSYAGKQAATWAYLEWEGHPEPNTKRTSTMKPLNDWIAARFGYKLGDEGYSWAWAFTKGLITTLPIAGLGCITQPVGREIASHAKGRLPYHHNFWMELVGDGLAYAAASLTFIYLVININY